MRNAELACPVVDRDLQDPMAGKPQEVGDEPVKATEAGEIRKTVPAHCAETARAVPYRILHHDVANPVRNPGRRALEPRIVSVAPPTGDGVPPIEPGEERGDVTWIVLQVDVHGD